MASQDAASNSNICQALSWTLSYSALWPPMTRREISVKGHTLWYSPNGNALLQTARQTISYNQFIYDLGKKEIRQIHWYHEGLDRCGPRRRCTAAHHATQHSVPLLTMPPNSQCTGAHHVTQTHTVPMLLVPRGA